MRMMDKMRGGKYRVFINYLYAASFKNVIRLGKLSLHHCDACNLPLIKKTCSCGNEGRKVEITPPGDVRPAFDFDKKLIEETIDGQFGDAWLPEVVILNATPAIDKKDEVIIDGRVAGNLVYDIWVKRFKFQPRPWYASLLKVKKGYVVADDGALPYILKTANLMAPGVREADEGIKKRDEVIVLDKDGNVIATGMARMDGSDMVGGRGMAVKIRWRGKEEARKGKKISWNDVIEENRDVIQSMVGNEKRFIHSVIEKYNLPYVVSFSGGKDSLATLLLLLDAGYEPDILFLNTGLEFDETVNHVYETAAKYGLEIKEGKAGEKFWEAIDFFGIPARDYRWCCKTCKLGVAAMLIKKNYPEGVLSFIGQRRYESKQRAEHGKIWKNPWVHGQIAASPIQNWTALHIWLYLFIKKARWNPLYEEGFSRIGCWLCPASDMAEFRLKKHRDWQRFEEKLKAFSSKHNLPKEWIELGLWRWRKPPGWSKIKYEIKEEREYVIEGNEERIENFLRIIGDVKKVDKREYEINGIRVKIGKEIEASGKEKLVKDVIYRAINCVGCGVCVAKCSQDAISIINGKAYISENCIHCLQCMEECPVIVFR